MQLAGHLVGCRGWSSQSVGREPSRAPSSHARGLPTLHPQMAHSQEQTLHLPGTCSSLVVPVLPTYSPWQPSGPLAVPQARILNIRPWAPCTLPSSSRLPDATWSPDPFTAHLSCSNSLLTHLPASTLIPYQPLLAARVLGRMAACGWRLCDPWHRGGLVPVWLPSWRGCGVLCWSR